MDTLARLFASMKVFGRKLSLLFDRNRYNRELEDELRFHREQSSRDLAAAGLSTPDAEHALRRNFGDDQRIREQSREAIAFRWEAVAHDARYALRQFARNPIFALTAIFVLALGLAASLTIFAFVDAALLKPLPYAQPSRIAAVYESSNGFFHNNVSWPDFVDYTKQNDVFSSIDA